MFSWGFELVKSERRKRKPCKSKEVSAVGAVVDVLVCWVHVSDDPARRATDARNRQATVQPMQSRRFGAAAPRRISRPNPPQTRATAKGKWADERSVTCDVPFKRPIPQSRQGGRQFPNAHSPNRPRLTTSLEAPRSPRPNP